MNCTPPAFLALYLLMIVMLPASTATADSFRKLLMPGELTQVHAEFEEDCDVCHDTSSKDKQGRLCMQCHDHENILDDISQKRGYHGRLPASVSTNCKHCHTDHKGRDHDIVLLNRSTFDHGKTDFRLDGAHSDLQCDSCHEPADTWAGAPHTCYACHEDDDTHKGKQGKRCDDCHSTGDWRKSSFDHDETDFPLQGAHRETACASCHVNREYKGTPERCVSCHGIHDAHLKTFGERCDSCHDSKDWNRAKYDHRRETGYALLGGHADMSCSGCHEPGSDAGKTGDACIDCHRFDDHHKGRYGEACKDCHRPDAWDKTRFDHASTDFALNGRHGEIACNFCHRGELGKEELPTDCYGCHEANDVHDGEQGRNCGNCHETSGWRGSKGFDHDLSAFPLLGMHASTLCDECHLDSSYGDTESACTACHTADDVHRKRLGTDCGSCHNPNSWQTWLFDHDKATRFKLDGAHEEVGCYDCHSEAVDGRLDPGSECSSCHRGDDPHRGQFGRDCGRCHTTTDFSEINLAR